MAPRPTCDCGSCAKCKRRAYMNEWYRRPGNAEVVRQRVRRYRIDNAEEVVARERAPARIGRCSCQTYALPAPDGTVLYGVAKHNPECREHGFPKDEWKTGSPLRVHARYVDREHGITFTYEEALEAHTDHWAEHEFPPAFDAYFRLETPSEVERRLLGRSAA